MDSLGGAVERRATGWLLVGWGVLLSVGLAGCGSASSDPVAEGPSPSAVTGQTGATAVESAGLLPTFPAQEGGGLPGFTEGREPQPVTGKASVSFGTGTEGDRSGDRSPAAMPSPAGQQAQREADERTAREQWYAAMRETQEAGARLSALEVWARQPGDALDPVTYGLVDEDDTVRARAQELYEQHLQREMQRDETR